MAEIAMSHPDIPGEIAHAFQEAFDEYWVKKGWVVVDEPDPDLPPDVNTDSDKKAQTHTKGSSQGEVGIDG